MLGAPDAEGAGAGAGEGTGSGEGGDAIGGKGADGDAFSASRRGLSHIAQFLDGESFIKVHARQLHDDSVTFACPPLGTLEPCEAPGRDVYCITAPSLPTSNSSIDPAESRPVFFFRPPKPNHFFILF